MHTIEITLREHELVRLEALATKRGVSRERVLYEALRGYLAGHPGVRQRSQKGCWRSRSLAQRRPCTGRAGRTT